MLKEQLETLNQRLGQIVRALAKIAAALQQPSRDAA
jgi:hypothetical protein